MSILEDVVWKDASHGTRHEFITRTSGINEFKMGPSVVHSIHLGKYDDLARQIFYGNSERYPTEFEGLSRFFSTTDRNIAQCAVNVLDAGGGVGTSIYLIVWSPETVYMVRSPDETGAAIVPKDWRYIVRICNIDTKKDFDLARAMSHAVYRLPSIQGDEHIKLTPVFYMNPDSWGMYNSQIGYIPMFRSIPIRVITEIKSREPGVY